MLDNEGMIMVRITIFIAILTFLFCSQALAERWAVNADKCNVRSGPGEEFEVIWQVEKYYPVDVIDGKDKWRFFRDVDGDEGWIHEDLLNKLDTIIIVKDHCNIRSGPGKEHNVTFIAEKGIPFRVVNRQKEWIEIEHADGDRGWVHSSLVW
jgi:SH3-like domain-containing protein